MNPRVRSAVQRQPNVPVILGNYVNALGIVRSLADAGLRSIVVDRVRGVAGWSRYADYCRCPDPAKEPGDCIQFLVDLGPQLPGKGVLFAIDDRWLALLGQHQQELSERYLFSMSGWEVLRRGIDKRLMYQVAERAGIPIPKTHYLPDGIAQWNDIVSELEFPCVVKPQVTIGFMERLGSRGRTIRLNDLSELRRWSGRIEKAGLGDVPVALQNEVVGPITNLYTIASYSDATGDIRGYSVGYKIRQRPSEAGTITAGRVHAEPEVYQLGSRLIKALGYRGVSNTEFKLDECDGEFKLMEINCRPGMWNRSAHSAGVNLPFMAYCDTVNPGCLSDTVQVGEKEIVWVHLTGDIAGYIQDALGNHHGSDSRLSLGKWWRSLHGRKVLAVESARDPVPMFADWLSLVDVFVRKLVARTNDVALF